MQIYFIVAYKHIHISDEGIGVMFQLYSFTKVPIRCSRGCDVLNLISDLSLPLIKRVHCSHIRLQNEQLPVNSPGEGYIIHANRH